MKAAVSSPNGLELRDIPQPVPKPNEVLVHVKACGLNRADLSAARAAYGHGVMGVPVGLVSVGPRRDQVLTAEASTAAARALAST